MWWNYRKPKPLKPGAFDMALKNHVPVVPCFITMADSDLVGADGFPVQEYTPHLGAPSGRTRPCPAPPPGSSFGRRRKISAGRPMRLCTAVAPALRNAGELTRTYLTNRTKPPAKAGGFAVCQAGL